MYIQHKHKGQQGKRTKLHSNIFIVIKSTRNFHNSITIILAGIYIVIVFIKNKKQEKFSFP